jgi:hypothetical protein
MQIPRHIYLFAGDDLSADTLEAKFDSIRATLQGVVDGYQTGAVIWGPGGTGKSYLVEKYLREAAPDKLQVYNSRVSPTGLLNIMKAHPDSLILIEDAEGLFKDHNALGLLRSALWSQDQRVPPVRRVTWYSIHRSDEFDFWGGLILVGNSDLPDNSPEAEALRSRVKVLHFDLTPGEQDEVIRRIVNAGHRRGKDYVAPAECMEVVKYVKDRCRETGRSLSIRLVVTALTDRAQWKAGSAGQRGWCDLVDERFDHVPSIKNHKQEMAHQAAIAQQIRNDSSLADGDAKYQEWYRRTGKSRKAYYRALNRG